MSSGRHVVARAAWRFRPTRPRSIYAQLLASERGSDEELEALRLDALRALLRAAEQVAFHRARLEAAGVSAADFSSMADIARIPTLERADLQALGVDRLSVPRARGMRVQSSGSTGRPVRALFPLEQRAWGDAVERRAAGWLGIELGDRRVHVSAARALTRSRNRIDAALLNRELVPARVLEDLRQAQRIVRRLERRRPASIEGVSNGLYALALVAREHAAALRPRVCWSGGNQLPDHYRATLESVFNCPVYERYSAWEVGMIAHQCPEERAWHVVAETVIAEILRPDGSQAPPGELGELAITCLRNRAMPLIRYRIGDLAVAGDGRRCSCGRSLPVLRSLIGRSNDLLRRPEGGWIVPTAVSRAMAEAGESIIEFRVHQTSDCRLLAQVVQHGEGLESAREAIRVRLDELLGVPGATTVERVDSIAAEPGGKLRHISSDAGLRTRRADPLGDLPQGGSRRR